MPDQYTLEEVAVALGARLEGDPQCRVSGLQTLRLANAEHISFLANPSYRKDLLNTKAAAVLLHESELDHCPCHALVLDNPYLGYARLSHWFDQRPAAGAGIHSTAVIAESAKVDASAKVGPYVVIEADAVIEADVELGANTVVGAGSVIGAGSRLAANVTVYHQVQIGQRAVIHSGAVIGSDGFGFANEQGKWHKIAQIGGVVIGDDVEIGASTTIDRGALDDTRIEDGVKLDNQIQIAHNVVVGQDSAFAGCAGVAGSTTIGRRCTLAGGVVVSGHLQLTDDVHITAMGLVTKSIPTPGVYSSGTGMQPNQQWKRNVVRFRQLDALAARVTELEKSLQAHQKKSELDGKDT